MIGMINNKGQALIEFILIIPILAIFILGLFDIGNIIYKKYQLENDLDYIVDLYNESKINDIDEYVKNKKIIISTDNSLEYTTITLSKNITFIAPGMSKILGDSYKISTNRVIRNGS